MTPARSIPALLVLALSSFLCPVAAQAELFPDMAAAKQAYAINNFSEAADNWAPLAQFGIAEAQWELGKLYLDGKGVTKDPGLAFSWIAQAAENGLPRAYTTLGTLYEEGIGTLIDLIKARDLYSRAVQSGETKASYHLGRFYERHATIPAPAESQTDEENFYAALRSLKEGKLAYAEQIGHYYHQGMGVQADNFLAAVYMTVAARAGSTSARQRLDTLQSPLSPEQRTAAEQQAETIIVDIRAPGFYESGPKGKSARHNNPDILQTMILPKKDREPDYGKALYYYSQAIGSGYLRAARNLGQLYEKGRGTDTDPVNALTYYYVARDSGIANAAVQAAALEEKLSLGEIGQAREAADHILKDHTPPAAPSNEFYKLSGTLKTQMIAEEGLDLRTRSSAFETGMAVDGRIGLFVYPADDMTAYVEGRALENIGVINSSDDDGETQMGASFVELRQAWVEFANLFDNPRLFTKLGRQRFRDDQGVWWNRDIDALRLSLGSTLTSGFIAVGQNMHNYRIGEEDHFRGDEKDRLRILSEISHRIAPDHTLEGRLLYENDYSGNKAIGSIVDNDDRDDEDARLLWFGLRAAGKISGNQTTLSYRLDGIGVSGSEQLSDSISGPGGGQRTITAQRKRDVRGWAVDGQIDVAFKEWMASPTVTLGYAYASGDDTPAGTATDKAFRQSGLEGNTSRPQENITQTNNRNYGEVLRPELSNLHIAKAGLHFPLINSSHINMSYFSYWLDEAAGGLRSSDISAPLNGVDNHIGQAIDFSVDVPIGQELNLQNDIANSLSSRILLGGFKAGDAYGAAAGEYAWRGTAEVRLRF
jgi:alginate production protein